MGFYTPDKGQLLLDGAGGRRCATRATRRRSASAWSTSISRSCPSLTAAENLVVSRADAPAVINWRKERAALEAFLATMPFRVPLDRPVSSLAAGEKQKLEILKLLYLDQRFLILDEPTSVLTPGEADEILGLLRDMAHRGEITVADDQPQVPRGRGVLRRLHRAAARRQGRRRQGRRRLDARDGDDDDRRRRGAPLRRARSTRRRAARRSRSPASSPTNDEGREAVAELQPQGARPGEIVGIAGVSGNGQSELVEALSGQRPIKLGQVLIDDKNFEPKRDHFDKFKVFGLPEEPLKNATVPTMSVAENMAFRNFDKPPIAKLGFWLSPGPMRAQGARPHRPLQREDALDRDADPRSLRRQRAARGAGARAFRATSTC